jgi:hypothetical protein
MTCSPVLHFSEEERRGAYYLISMLEAQAQAQQVHSEGISDFVTTGKYPQYTAQ